MLLEIRALRFVVPLIGALFFVAACGGSGGGGTTTPAPAPDPAPDDPAPDDPAPDDPAPAPQSALTTLQSLLATPSAMGPLDHPDRNIVLQTLGAANNPPIGGASANGGVGQISGDIAGIGSPRVVVTENAGADRTFRVSLPHSAHSTLLILTTTTALAGVGGNEHLVQAEFLQEGGGATATFTPQRTAGVGDVVTFNEPQPPVDAVSAPDGTGRLYVYLRTDIPDSIGDDTDYLAYGFWIHDPVGTAAGDIPAIGVFVDSPATGFPGANVLALAGTATYAGDAEGLYHEEVAGESDFRTFTADASLTADFGNATELGTVAGTITSFVGLPTEFADLEVALVSTALTAGDGGFFNAATSATLTLDGESRDLAGTWGGKFYENTDPSRSDTDHPGTVAGTFGLQGANEDPDDATRMNRRALLGIYWADVP